MNDQEYARFKTKFVEKDCNECWPWIAYRAKNGYGNFGLNGKTRLAHVLAFERANGYIPEEVMHTCDNPWCVNPNHLKGGNKSKNMIDSFMKNRGPNQLLSVEQVAEMKAELLQDSSKRNIDLLVKKYGCSLRTVHYIRTGEKWAQVQPKVKETNEVHQGITDGSN